jgi:hypothetical protein
MKKVTFIGMIIILAAVVIYSCKKKEKDDETPAPVQNTVIAKWLVTGAAVSDFTSFEFNKSGSFIVVTPNSTHFGDYTKTGSEMTLKNYGIISITKLTATECDFTFTPFAKGTKNTYTITSTKAPTIALIGNTALLCRTWSLLSIDSVPAAGTDMELTVLFSEAGTYLVHYITYDENGLAQWQWKDDTQKMICYNWYGLPTCSGDNEVIIQTLTSSKLIMIEDERYELVPYTAKSSLSYSNLVKTYNSHKFFGR